LTTTITVGIAYSALQFFVEDPAFAATIAIAVFSVFAVAFTEWKT
jgi:hypothetical protein